jgi:hypothetical protein
MQIKMIKQKEMIMKRMFYLFFVFLPILFSCTDETASDTATSSSGVVTKVGFSLSAAKMQGMPETKSTDATTIDDSKIENLWVLQFQGGTLAKISYFSSVNTTSFDADLKAGANSKIYFVANAGLNAFATPPADETAFKIATKSLSAEADLFYVPSTGKKSVPMFGNITLDVPATGALAKQTVTLTRMLSRVDITYSVNVPNFTLSKIRVCNVPKKMQYCPPATGTLFPATLTSADVQNYNYTGNLSATGGTLTFYIPENQRGTGGNTTTDPRLKNGNGVTNATYLELIGYSNDADGSIQEITYCVYPGTDNVNDYNIVRNTYYTVAASIKGISESDARISRQLARSNCYMVKPNSMIRIPIQRANESDLGTQISDVTSSGWTAEVLWQTADGLVTVSNTAADRTNGIFRVSAGATVGNAVVAVRNAGGTILWSWHIWVSDYDPSTTTMTYNGSTWMDRNLGATTNGTSATAYGLYYQWGRKDPFPGGTNGTSTFLTTYGNYKPAIGSGAAPLLTSVQAPTVFRYNTVPPYDWLSVQNDLLWNKNGKTVYDPCPIGWRVPLNTQFNGVFPSGNNVLSGIWVYDGNFGYAASNGYWWSGVTSNAYAYYLSSNGNVYGSNRAYGFSVRCIKE